MSIKKTTLITTAALIFASTNVMAESQQEKAELVVANNNQATEEKDISLTGEIKSIDKQAKSFVLKNDKGTNVIIQSTASIESFNEGDKVSVHGQLDDDALGHGSAITSAKVKVLN